MSKTLTKEDFEIGQIWLRNDGDTEFTKEIIGIGERSIFVRFPNGDEGLRTYHDMKTAHYLKQPEKKLYAYRKGDSVHWYADNEESCRNRAPEYDLIFPQEKN